MRLHPVNILFFTLATATMFGLLGVFLAVLLPRWSDCHRRILFATGIPITPRSIGSGRSGRRKKVTFKIDSASYWRPLPDSACGKIAS